MEQKKPWYKSKIVFIALIGIATLVTNHLNGWLTGQVTPGQIETIQALDPAISETVRAVKNGESWITAAYSTLLAVIAAVRVWFTKKTLES